MKERRLQQQLRGLPTQPTDATDRDSSILFQFSVVCNFDPHDDDIDIDVISAAPDLSRRRRFFRSDRLREAGRMGWDGMTGSIKANGKWIGPLFRLPSFLRSQSG